MNSLALAGLLPVLLTGALVLQPSAKAEDVVPLDLLLQDEAVANGELERSRGGEAVIVKLNNNQLEAQSYNNQVWDTTTGANMIGGMAFNGVSGLSSVVQNSGNNVIIQDSTIINIELHAAP